MKAFKKLHCLSTNKVKVSQEKQASFPKVLFMLLRYGALFILCSLTKWGSLWNDPTDWPSHQNASRSIPRWDFWDGYWSECILLWHTKLGIWQLLECLLVTVFLSKLDLRRTFIVKYHGVTGTDSGWCPNDLAQIHIGLSTADIGRMPCDSPGTLEYGVFWEVAARLFLTYLSHSKNLWNSFSFLLWFW